MMTQLPSTRATYWIGFIAICGLLGLSLYLQIHDNMSPCPLCILQRITLVLLGLVFFLGALLKLKTLGKTVTGLLAGIVALGGVLLAGRQVWLQHMPPASGETCGASLQYMLQVLPLDEVVRKVLQGGAECSQIGWAFWGFSLAEWSLVGFSAFLLMALWQLRRQ